MCRVRCARRLGSCWRAGSFREHRTRLERQGVFAHESRKERPPVGHSSCPPIRTPTQTTQIGETTRVNCQSWSSAKSKSKKNSPIHSSTSTSQETPPSNGPPKRRSWIPLYRDEQPLEDNCTSWKCKVNKFPPLFWQNSSKCFAFVEKRWSSHYVVPRWMK